MLRKSVLSAICVGNGAFDTATRRIVGSMIAQRTFSSSSRRNASIAHFTPTSSPQLDNILNEIRYKLILPSYLPSEQRRKIYSKKYEKKLQHDPITMEIDGEVIKFRYQNIFTDIPQARRLITSALQQFSTPDDFANLRPLLEGIANMKVTLGEGFWAMMIRVLSGKGAIFEILECARSVGRTGFKLNSSEKVNEVMFSIQDMAFDSGWDEAKTAKALRWAEMVLDMLQEKGHKPKALSESELPLYRDPMVLLAPLHLAARLAVKQQEGSTGVPADTMDKVNKYARDVVLLWPEDKAMSEVQPSQLYRDFHKLGYLREANKVLALATPLLSGLDTAIEVVEPALATQLQTRRDKLAAQLQEARRGNSMRIQAAKDRKIAEQMSPDDVGNRGGDIWEKYYGKDDSEPTGVISE
ncbi:hypothetical protein GGR54DRAFT_635613 [Hypoxylon sp. NC1633]|nr:hypothetical protein GGR54DRAFT_635613 [Hypoxylon sp. NC1633]